MNESNTGDDNSLIERGMNRCPKCDSLNTILVGKDKDRSFHCLDCDYAEGIGV